MIRTSNSFDNNCFDYTYESAENLFLPRYGMKADTNPFRYCGEYFDEETGFVYLRARYYSPDTGRFVSEDTHWTIDNMIFGDDEHKENQPNILSVMQSSNLYVYCGNNPIVFFDCTGFNTSSVFQNADGTYSLYDNDRFGNKNAWHEQIFSVSLSGPSWDLKNGSVGLGSVEGNAFTGGWEWKHVDLSLFDFGHAEVGLEIKDGAIDLGAQASVWSPSVSVTVLGVKTEAGIEIGAIGLSAKGSWNVSAKGLEIYIALGVGVTLSISW